MFKIFIEGTALGGGCVILPNYKTQVGTTTTPSNVTSSVEPVGYCRSGDFRLNVYINGTFLSNDGGTLWLDAHLTFEEDTPPVIHYDCLNGVCTLSTQYKTPGIYNSLADCQAVCANGGACAEGKHCVDPTTFCPDGKVCIDQGEFASIETLISKIGSEVC